MTFMQKGRQKGVFSHLEVWHLYIAARSVRRQPLEQHLSGSKHALLVGRLPAGEDATKQCGVAIQPDVQPLCRRLVLQQHSDNIRGTNPSRLQQRRVHRRVGQQRVRAE